MLSPVNAPRTVLYVEDNPANLKQVEVLITRRPDLRLLSAGDAAYGIEIAREVVPDVILMDIILPGINGYSALEQLHADPITRNIPVIALSARAMPDDVARGVEAGFFRYVTKPFMLNVLMTAIDAALNAPTGTRHPAQAVAAHSPRTSR